MAITISPEDFNHFVDLNLLDHSRVIGLTNNPSKITFSHLRNVLIKSNIKITNTRGKNIDFEEICFRNGNDIKDDTHIIHFNGPIAKVDGVIKIENGYYPPIYEPDTIPDINKYTLSPYGKTFNVFVRDSKCFQVSVNSNTKIGYIAKIIHERLGYPIGLFKMIAKSQYLVLDKTIGDYQIENDMTINVKLGLKGGMFHVTSGRSGNYDNFGIMFVNLDDM